MGSSNNIICGITTALHPVILTSAVALVSFQSGLIDRVKTI